MPEAIGTLNEKPLHAALKAIYAQPGDTTEVRVDGWIIDIVREDCLVEIQTRHLGAMKRKLVYLVQQHCVRLVYPLAVEKWIVRLSNDGVTVAGRRKSPKQGAIEQVFAELVSIPRLFLSPNFALEVALIREEEVRHPDSTVNWRRRGWAVTERRLLDLIGSRVFDTPADLAALLPSDLPDLFTAGQLAQAIGQPLPLAQKMAYCLREMEVLQVAGRQGRGYLYTRVQNTHSAPR